MTTARLKTPVREVWQYESMASASRFMPSWVDACTEPRHDGLYLVRRSGKQIIHPGEWLIRDLDDPSNHEWVDDATFQREYELT